MVELMSEELYLFNFGMVKCFLKKNSDLGFSNIVGVDELYICCG